MAGFFFIENGAVRKVPQLRGAVFACGTSAGGDVLYAPVEAAPAALPAPFRPYTLADNQARQAKCQSALAHLATVHREFTAPAVRRVTQGVVQYLGGQVANPDAAWAKVVQCVRKYMYSPAGYGRLGQPGACPTADADLVPVFNGTIRSGGLPAVLAIHDFMGRIVFQGFRRDNPPGMNETYAAIGRQVRPAYLFGVEEEFTGTVNGAAVTVPKTPPARVEQLRGRVKRAQKPVPTKTAGVLPRLNPLPGSDPFPMQERQRGVDLWQPATGGAAPPFTRDLEQRGLLFGAGPSGSTGTLLQAGITFGNLAGDLLNQYALAIVAYLVGGGMHTHHEVMSVCARVGVPYRGGVYDESLPSTFTATQVYRDWRDRYYDVAVIGWRARAGAPGSPPR